MDETQKEGKIPTPGIITGEDNLRRAIKDTAPSGIDENRIYHAGATKTLESGISPTPSEELAWIANNILAEDNASLRPLEAADLFNIVGDVLQEEYRDLREKPESEEAKASFDKLFLD